MSARDEALDPEALDLRLEAYLDGLLSPSETRATERMLAEPEVARALAEALALRELLGASGVATPDGLAERIIEGLGLEAPQRDQRSGARARTSARGASAGAQALAGLGTVRYALGPLRAPVGEAVAERTSWRTWWRAARALGGRR